MRIISVVGLNSGQDEDVQEQQQLKGVGSGRAQACVEKCVENSYLGQHTVHVPRLAGAAGGYQSPGEGVLKETRRRQAPEFWGK